MLSYFKFYLIFVTFLAEFHESDNSVSPEQHTNLNVNAVFFVDQLEKYCRSERPKEAVSQDIVNAICQEKSIALLYTPRLITQVKGHLTRTHHKWKKSRKGGNQRRVFKEKLAQRQPYRCKVLEKEFVHRADFQRCQREWEQYEDQLKDGNYNIVSIGLR